MVAFCSCPFFGQGQESLEPDKYEQWGTFSQVNISPKGDWMTFSVDHTSGMDTLYLASTVIPKRFAFPKAHFPAFINDTLFCYLDNDHAVHLTGLTGNYSYSRRDINTYVVAGRHILLHKQTGELIVVNLHTGQEYSTANVSSFSLSPDKSKLVISTVHDSIYKVCLLDIDKPDKPRLLLSSTANAYLNFVWHKDSGAFVFKDDTNSAASARDYNLYFYSLTEDRLYSTGTTNMNWPDNFDLAAYPELLVSDDRSTVFMLLAHKSNKIKPPTPQIWNAYDKVLYPYKKANGSFSSYSRLYLWKPHSGNIASVGDQCRTGALLLDGQLQALIYDPSENRPALKYYADRDLYIKDLKTGKYDLVLPRFEGRQENLVCSPEGRYIAYYKDGNWWTYSITSGRHINLTGKLDSEFSDQEYDRPGSKPAYGYAGWSFDGVSLFVYDRYDVWELAANGKKAQRLTSGSEEGLIFRIHNFDSPIGEGYNLRSRIIDTQAPLFLTAGTEDNAVSKVFRYYKGIIDEILAGNEKFSILCRAANAHSYIVAAERYDSPPTLLHVDNKKCNAILQGNTHHYKYRWGKSELIDYTNSAGQLLKGSLFFPIDYQPEKKYPMVVHIYERQTHHLHSYTNPSLYNAAGFNKANFTGNAYFVYYPDITYDENAPGISALDCVTAAVKAVIAKYPVSSDKIGLIGHSFGGYETNYIISRSDMFAAAVSGNGISDLVSCYYSVGWSYGLPNTWRFESDQFRIAQTPFDNSEAYQDNSPISFVRDVSTPLLSWIGENDTQVNPIQTIEYHIALRRLGKENIMLVYPDEGHVLVNPTNQIDLTSKIMQWFDYLLKSDSKPCWVKPAED